MGSVSIYSSRTLQLQHRSYSAMWTVDTDVSFVDCLYSIWLSFAFFCISISPCIPLNAGLRGSGNNFCRYFLKFSIPIISKSTSPIVAKCVLLIYAVVRLE